MKYLIPLLAAVLAACTTTPITPTPEPSAVPSPVVTSSPTPSPTPTETPIIGKIDNYAMRGEVLGFDVYAKGTTVCSNCTIYEIKQVETKIPSFKGASVGLYDDPLIPATSVQVGKHYWVKVSFSQSGDFTIDVLGNSYAIRVIDADMPAKPTIPMYMELQSAQLLRAHKLQDHVSVQGPITKKYIDLYRAHRIEPIKQNITAYPSTNFDQWKEFNASFNQLVIDGAIAPPCLFGPLPNQAPPSALLNAFKSAIDSKQMDSRAWSYAWDEGEGDSGVTDQALARVKLIKQTAPNLRVMITRQEDPPFLPYVDTFVPVMDWFKQPGKMQTYTKPYGLYTSCMANGNCQNKSSSASVASASGTPMMVLDAPAVHARAFPVVGYFLGASSLLYYNGTQRLPTAWDVGGQYNEGGNGDGTLVYACGDTGCPSLRMERILQGMNDIEWLALAKRKGISVNIPVKSAFDWSKNPVDYDAMRKQISEGLK